MNRLFLASGKLKSGASLWQRPRSLFFKTDRKVVVDSSFCSARSIATLPTSVLLSRSASMKATHSSHGYAKNSVTVSSAKSHDIRRKTETTKRKQKKRRKKKKTARSASREKAFSVNSSSSVVSGNKQQKASEHLECVKALLASAASPSPQHDSPPNHKKKGQPNAALENSDLLSCSPVALVRLGCGGSAANEKGEKNQALSRTVCWLTVETIQQRIRSLLIQLILLHGASPLSSSSSHEAESKRPMEGSVTAPFTPESLYEAFLAHADATTLYMLCWAARAVGVYVATPRAKRSEYQKELFLIHTRQEQTRSVDSVVGTKENVCNEGYDEKLFLIYLGGELHRVYDNSVVPLAARLSTADQPSSSSWLYECPPVRDVAQWMVHGILLSDPYFRVSMWSGYVCYPCMPSALLCTLDTEEAGKGKCHNQLLQLLYYRFRALLHETHHVRVPGGTAPEQNSGTRQENALVLSNVRVGEEDPWVWLRPAAGSPPEARPAAWTLLHSYTSLFNSAVAAQKRVTPAWILSLFAASAKNSSRVARPRARNQKRTPVPERRRTVMEAEVQLMETWMSHFDPHLFDSFGCAESANAKMVISLQAALQRQEKDGTPSASRQLEQKSEPFSFLREKSMAPSFRKLPQSGWNEGRAGSYRLTKWSTQIVDGFAAKVWKNAVQNISSGHMVSNMNRNYLYEMIHCCVGMPISVARLSTAVRWNLSAPPATIYKSFFYFLVVVAGNLSVAQRKHTALRMAHARRSYNAIVATGNRKHDREVWKREASVLHNLLEQVKERARLREAGEHHIKARNGGVSPAAVAVQAGIDSALHALVRARPLKEGNGFSSGVIESEFIAPTLSMPKDMRLRRKEFTDLIFIRILPPFRPRREVPGASSSSTAAAKDLKGYHFSLCCGQKFESIEVLPTARMLPQSILKHLHNRCVQQRQIEGNDSQLDPLWLETEEEFMFVFPCSNRAMELSVERAVMMYLGVQFRPASSLLNASLTVKELCRLLAWEHEYGSLIAEEMLVAILMRMSHRVALTAPSSSLTNSIGTTPLHGARGAGKEDEMKRERIVAGSRFANWKVNLIGVQRTVQSWSLDSKRIK